jgi:hypothetical protein
MQVVAEVVVTLVSLKVQLVLVGAAPQDQPELLILVAAAEDGQVLEVAPAALVL